MNQNYMARGRVDRAWLEPEHLVSDRAATVEAAVSDLQDTECRGVVIHGVFGSGTSTVSRAVLAHFVENVAILRAEHNTAAAEESQLGGMAFVVAALAQDLGVEQPPLNDSAGAFDLLARVCRRLRRTAGPVPLLVVQDLHKMPSAAQRLVASLLSAGLIKVVLVASTASASHAVGDLLPVLRRGLLRAHTLSVLDGAGVTELMEQELGATVPLLTAQWATMLTAGIPRLVVSYLDRAREDGLLLFDDGLWHFVGPVEGVSDELREVVAIHLADLTEAQRQVLFVVVLAERIEMNPAINGVLGEALEALIESGLVQSRYEAHRWILIPSCEHFAEAVRQHLPPGLAVSLGPLHSTVLEKGLTPVSRAAWGVNTGTLVHGADLVALAASANDRLWADYALRTVEGPLEPQWQAAADMERLRARVKLRHHLEAGAIATAIAVDQLSPRQLRVLMTCEGLLRGTGELVYTDQQWEQRWRPLAQRCLEQPELDTADRAFFAELETLFQLWSDWSGPPQVLHLDRWRGLQDSPVPEIAMLSLASLGRALTRAADLDTASEAWSRALLLVEANPGLLSVFTDVARIGRLWATALSGDAVAPLSALPNTWGPEDSSPYLALAGHYYAASGMSLLLKGTVSPALPYFQAAVACSRDDTSPFLLAMCRSALDLITLLTTGESSQRSLVEEPESGGWSDGDLLPLRWSHVLFESVTQTAQGNAADISSLIAVVDSSLAEGEVVTAQFALAQVMQTGEDAFVRKLMAVSEGTSGLYQQMVARICRAVMTVDVDELVSVGLQCHAAEFDGLAGDALERALVLLSPYASSSMISTVTQVADAAFKSTGRSMRRRTATGGRRRSTLTEREQEVAELVAQGLTNAQVAQELGLGRRTVEGHVYRLFDKLGISQRGEVQEALQS
ncbi:LuxR C-terminal-related transcriptional regulator [Kocuria sp.]|uniref:LuxR C-terminal-related transcriptional regulator n=1 Tax=Kocuria sp. TaxID=1871328 RepID=UPI0026E0A220|nr:LuxR C-terminal-related transcriptional regulator [Kocuria sp.]MDO5619070.1 LuxR C-terminal-related transcriptional regulator [Kocuria sp.]